MNYHPTGMYLRQWPNSCFRQQLHRQLLSLLGDRRVWLATRKRLLVLGPAILAVNLWLSSLITDFAQNIQALEHLRYALTESKLNLKAERDQLFSPEHILVLAADKLALIASDKNHVQVY